VPLVLKNLIVFFICFFQIAKMNRLKIYRQSAKAESASDSVVVSHCVPSDAEKGSDENSKDGKTCASMHPEELKGTADQGSKKLLLPTVVPHKLVAPSAGSSTVSIPLESVSSGVLTNKRMQHTVDTLPDNVIMKAAVGGSVQYETGGTTGHFTALGVDNLSYAYQSKKTVMNTSLAFGSMDVRMSTPSAPAINQVAFAVPLSQARLQPVSRSMMPSEGQTNAPHVQVASKPPGLIPSMPLVRIAMPLLVPRSQVACVLPLASSHILSSGKPSADTSFVRLAKVPAGLSPHLQVAGAPLGKHPRFETSATAVSAASGKTIVIISKSCEAVQSKVTEEEAQSADTLAIYQDSLTRAYLLDPNNRNGTFNFICTFTSVVFPDICIVSFCTTICGCVLRVYL
jgi:hypothetical protein